MRYRGLLGFRRLTGKGPLTFKQSGSRSIDEIEEMVVAIIEDEGIDPDNPTEEELETVVSRLAHMMFDSEEEVITPIGPLPKPGAFEICMGSEWVDDWESGFRRVTTGLASEFESLIIKANGCEGIVESGNVFATQLIFTEEDCELCKLQHMP